MIWSNNEALTAGGVGPPKLLCNSTHTTPFPVAVKLIGPICFHPGPSPALADKLEVNPMAGLLLTTILGRFNDPVEFCCAQI